MPLSAIALVGRVLEKALAAVPHDTGSDAIRTGQMLMTLRRSVMLLEKLVGPVLEANTHLQTEVGV